MKLLLPHKLKLQNPILLHILNISDLTIAGFLYLPKIYKLIQTYRYIDCIQYLNQLSLFVIGSQLKISVDSYRQASLNFPMICHFRIAEVGEKSVTLNITFSSEKNSEVILDCTHEIGEF